jgi:hypothetical protein
MISFAPPPFSATPLGWFLASMRRLGWRIRFAVLGESDDS